MEKAKHVRIRDDQIKIVNADFRTVTLPKKCDLIFCDPPYSREHLTLYGDLGAWAKTNLKRGGYLACYAGHYHLPDVLDQLRKTPRLHLDICDNSQRLLRHQSGLPAQYPRFLEADLAIQ